MVDVKCLRDCELQNRLENLGFSPGPMLPSTRKLYEKKLVQLLVSPPCTAPMMNGPRELHGPEDSDDSEELNIILKGNITVSTEKSKEPKKNPVFEIRQEQKDIVKPLISSDNNDSEIIIKRPKAFTTNPKALDVYCPNYKAFKKIRCAARAASIRIKGGTITKGKDCCVVNWNVESRGQEVFPVGLKLAVLGIFIIVVFVYITVEKKPLFG